MAHRSAGVETGLGVGYCRHRPEDTLHYQIIERYYPLFEVLRAEQRRALPPFVQREFEEYLKCGQLEHGFLRVRCSECHTEKLVAFSCKRPTPYPVRCAKLRAKPANTEPCMARIRILAVVVSVLLTIVLATVLLLNSPPGEVTFLLEGNQELIQAAPAGCTKTWNCAFSNGDDYTVVSFCCYTCTFVSDNPAGCSGITGGVKSLCHWEGNGCSTGFTLRD